MAGNITIAQAESILVRRRGPAMIASGLTPTPAADASPRAYLSDALAVAVREQGVALADPTAPSPAEIAAIPDVDRLLDVADLRLLETLISSFIQVDWSTNVQKQWLDQYRQGLLKQLEDRRDYVRRVHGFGRGKLGAATIDLGFAQTGPIGQGCE